MKKIILAILFFVLGVFSWWAFSPLLNDKEVHEELDPTLKARLEAQRKVDENRARQTATQKPASETEVPIVTTSDNSLTTTNSQESADIILEGPFKITGTAGHPATGEVEIIRSPEETLIQYKNYNGTNGPDLKIYLAKDLEAKDFINLGDAKGNKGNIIYGAPLDIDFSEYTYVLTWCEAFGILFDYAKIN